MSEPDMIVTVITCGGVLISLIFSGLAYKQSTKKEIKEDSKEIAEMKIDIAVLKTNDSNQHVLLDKLENKIDKILERV